MNVLRGLVGVLVALAVSVGFVQFLELMLANALAGHALQSLDDYATVLNSMPLLAVRIVVSSFMGLLGGYICAKLAEHEEMRYTLMAVTFRVIAIVAGNVAGYMPRTPALALAILLIVSTGAMVTGGAIRAEAATVQRKTAGTSTSPQGEKL
jgi:hypothetical protein